MELASDPTTTYSSIHGPISGVGDYLQLQLVNHGAGVTADFHNYWVSHAENSITFGVDNTVLATFTPESLPPTAQWVFNKSFYAVMSVAVGRSAGQHDAVVRGHARLGAVAARLRR